MGLLPLSNHLALIKECYPPPSSSSDLPAPLSNPLGKLTFYGVNRPQKTPKVLAALVERARTAAGAGGAASSSGGGAGAGGKAREDLAVTVEIVRALVVEWGESGKDEAPGVIKNAVAEGALRVAELALGGGSNGAELRSVKQQRRDPELEARGASLFHAVATYLSPPFLGTQLEEGRGDGSGMGRAYLLCLSLVSSLAQVEEAKSRYIALNALAAAASSEFLVSAASVQDYVKQVEEIVPALLSNVVETDVTDLKEQLVKTLASKSTLSPLPFSLSSRKSSSISPPSSALSHSSLSSLALPPLLTLFRLAPSPHALTALLASLTTFLDSHSPSTSSLGPSALWHAPSQPFVVLLARDAVLPATADPLRPTAASWWVDRVGEIYDTGSDHKSGTLLHVLKKLLASPDGSGSGVNKSAALHTLLELLVRRARFRARGVHSPGHSPNVSMGALVVPSASGTSTPASPPAQQDEEDEDRDPLLPSIYSTIAALARSASSASSGYKGELDDLAASLVAVLRSLCGTPLSPSSASGSERATRFARGLSGEELSRARRRVVKALRVFVEGAERIPGFEVARTTEGLGVNGLGGGRWELERNGGSEATILPPRSGEKKDAEAADGTVRAIRGDGIPGLHLGAVVDADSTVRAPKTSADSTLSSTSSSNSRPAIPSQIVTVASPTVSSPPSPYFPSSTPKLDPSAREPVALFTFSPSLFLLSFPDPALRLEYARTLRAYLKTEAPAALAAAPAGESTRFFRLFFGQVHSVARGEISSPSAFSPLSATHPSASPSVSSAFPPSSPPASRPLTSSGSPSASSLPLPSDYSALLQLLSTALSILSPSAVLEGFPVFAALDGGAATNWEVGLAGGELGLGAGVEGGRDGGGKDQERAQACREVTAWGVREVGRVWGVGEVEEVGRETLDALSPLVIPISSSSSLPPVSAQFAAIPLAATSASLDINRAIKLLASSSRLQRAAGLDRAALASALARSWETVKSEGEASSPSRSLYLSTTLPSRSFLNLSLGASGSGTPLHHPLGTASRAGSTLRLASASISTSNGGNGNGSLAPSSRHASLSYSLGTSVGSSLNAPSLADLQHSLGGGNGIGQHGVARSTRTTSAAQSFVSTATGETGLTSGGGGRRRTNRQKAESVLEKVGRGGGRNRARSLAPPPS
ncbi:hypothetical protein JCM8547_003467 [Rhodosporidiobolus lusitaniae]